MSRSSEQIEALKKRVAKVTSWYHAIDLGDGVMTPGVFQVKSFRPEYGIPDQLDGQRVLDVGASSGFFACEMDRRGAAEVVALDLPGWGDHDWTPRYRADFESKSAEERAYIDDITMRAGFDLVVESMGCKNVRKHEAQIYELSPETVGMFDYVFCGSMLMHVRDPILGIQAMRSVLKPTGRMTVTIAMTLPDTDDSLARFVGDWDQCNWWQMSPRCLDRILKCCDLEVLDERNTFTLTNVDGSFQDPTYVVHARPRQR
ncbi:MAG: methyltransferase domain-containing protein [Planctomycetota bacterium]|jgi:tRNA (mo5U34)-methyltransferase|nr:methyltransferase domain-containing protein [Planctomycetota bacterium]